MILHGRYRVVRRKAADLRVGEDGVWTLFEGGKVIGKFSREWIKQNTGMEPEENALGGWRCFWQETPRRAG